MVVKIKNAQWKHAAIGVRNLDAEAVERELTRLARTESLTPEAVLSVARDPESALHHGFTWDDGVAAEKYRLQEAAKIIRCLVYLEETPHGEREIRCFVNVKGRDEDAVDATTKGFYVTTKAAMSDPVYRRHVLDNAMQDAIAYADKYRDLEELSRIIRAIDSTVRAYEREHATV